MERRRQRLIESKQAAKVGRRYHAFYQGFQAQRNGSPENPHKAATEDHASWQAGWRYAEAKEGKP